MSIEEQKSFLGRLAKGIACLFGENCEVTVHDLTGGYENTIVAIENGHVTGRHVGDGASEVVLRALAAGAGIAEDQCSYLARTKAGRMVKSSSVFVRDAAGKPVGLFGINYDITDLVMAQRALEAAVSVEKPAEERPIGAITTSVGELLDHLIAETDALIGKPVAMMSRDDKTLAVQRLAEKGAFLIKKAGDKVSRHYDISKYTLYNYMDAEL